ncbi:MAG: CGNR zinc finger domain-containing protein [Nocardioides sp.]
MHWIETEGVHLPKPLAGHPALELCNTWAGWVEDPPPGSGDVRREWLAEYDVLAVWAFAHDLVTREQLVRLRADALADPEAALAALDDARALRTAVHDAVLDPADATALDEVGGYARRAGAVMGLAAGDGHARWELGPEAALDLPVLSAACSAAELLTSPQVAFVAACPGADCGWLFLDRRRRRRWCDMAACGNRAKVAAHARRQTARATGRVGERAGGGQRPSRST